MIGLVLAAGAGRRLRPWTDTLPKTLVPIGAGTEQETTVLDLTLANFAAVGLTDVAVVVGYAADQVAARQQALEERYGVQLELVHNDKAEEWNNCYSLWCARDLLAQGVVLANGDTVHPVSVEHTLLAAKGTLPGPGLVLALDTEKSLADEEMKVVWSEGQGVRRITKLMPPEDATGEYIGVTLIEPPVVDDLVAALQATWERDPQLYYEDGYQELADRGVRVDVAPIGHVDWVEIDNHDDLARAQGIAAGIVATRGS
ncbi:MAG: sugar phosphate nucleotidyltransferase [Actinomycetes bacterium]